MSRILLLSTVLFAMTACSRGTDVAPTLAGEVAGSYQTNGYLDVSCVALPATQMPAVGIRQESDVAVTITYQRQYPVAQTFTLPHVQLQRLVDQRVKLVYAGEDIGTAQMDRAFSSNGMESQAMVLRLSRLAGPESDRFVFIGSKQ
ncbi:hypothetical protein [Fibrella aquatilis]|uniref:Lipoprotein n=1 Tax=Fibrella aquatilis TaxID=2817059 RepID=A0A939JZ14_9BACT|nr:hypothetical protein [Fibrella aquatilis]MBO0932679.1 hypothetical protein [Fibrella aquatilis]